MCINSRERPESLRNCAICRLDYIVHSQCYMILRMHGTSLVPRLPSAREELWRVMSFEPAQIKWVQRSSCTRRGTWG